MNNQTKRIKLYYLLLSPTSLPAQVNLVASGHAVRAPHPDLRRVPEGGSQEHELWKLAPARRILLILILIVFRAEYRSLETG
jgi:hypothetical protein